MILVKQFSVSINYKRKMGEEIGHTFTVVAFDIKACRQALARMIIVD